MPVHIIIILKTDEPNKTIEQRGNQNSFLIE